MTEPIEVYNEARNDALEIYDSIKRKVATVLAERGNAQNSYDYYYKNYLWEEIKRLKDKFG